MTTTMTEMTETATAVAKSKARTSLQWRRLSDGGDGGGGDSGKSNCGGGGGGGAVTCYLLEGLVDRLTSVVGEKGIP